MLGTSLIAAAHHGRVILIAGLVAGIALPDLAAALKPFLPEMVAFLLFLAALRIGPRQAIGASRDFSATLVVVALFQIAMPLALFAVFNLLGLSGPLTFAIILMAAGASISGSANLAILSKADPAPALRLIVVGTALLPLTVLPTFWILPQLGSPQVVLAVAARLLAIIIIAAIAGFGLRHLVLSDPQETQLKMVDGLSAIAMAIVVVGLMAAIGPALRAEPQHVLIAMAAACAANFGLQLLVWFSTPIFGERSERASWAIVAGNRNMALFLAALPGSVIDPILLFIGCYQIPMYLTPLLFSRFYGRSS